MYYNTSILVAALTNHNDKLIEENKKLQLELDQANAKIEVKDKRIAELEADIRKKSALDEMIDRTNYNRGFEAGKQYALNTPGQVFQCTVSNKNSGAYLEGYKDGLDYAHNFVAKYLNKEVKK